MLRKWHNPRTDRKRDPLPIRCSYRPQGSCSPQSPIRCKLHHRRNRSSSCRRNQSIVAHRCKNRRRLWHSNRSYKPTHPYTRPPRTHRIPHRRQRRSSNCRRNRNPHRHMCKNRQNPWRFRRSCTPLHPDILRLQIRRRCRRRPHQRHSCRRSRTQQLGIRMNRCPGCYPARSYKRHHPYNPRMM